MRRLARDTAGRVVVDLGAGTGTGTVALARRFDRAEVHAVDASDAMLARVAERAVVDGLADRIRPVRADLDAAWPALPPADVVWASLMLHEVADPARLLGRIRDGLAPGGILAVVEMDGPPRFLPGRARPADLGRPGPRRPPRRRRHARRHGRPVAPGLGAVAAPPPGSWRSRRARSPSTPTRRIRSPRPRRSPTPARGWPASATAPPTGSTTDDRAALDALLDDDGPHALARIPDLRLRGTRTAYVGRRPR
ncbi:class I SAM-dependent methyltransferase [Clavibacter zhangzhiyongii]|uniref:class I SAM-dependent methyltransferase n=1 Tax=Clavibacter zhangzhiyongii TaxID=2768071 RepID=UPI0039E0820D